MALEIKFPVDQNGYTFESQSDGLPLTTHAL